MKYLMALMIALLVPTAAMAAGECKADRQKFCKDVIKAKGDIGACLDQHTSELSEACKTKREANKAEKKDTSAEDSAKMGKGEGTHTGPSPTPESDTKKIDQPERRNVPSNETPKE